MQANWSEITDYRDFLKSYMDIKKQQNPGLSLRAFAKKFEVSPSYLSEILSRKQLTPGTAAKIKQRLDCDEDTQEYFYALVVRQAGKQAEAVRRAEDYLSNFRRKQKLVNIKKHFSGICDWHYMAIFVYLMTYRKLDAKAMAVYFNLSLPAVESAVSKLKKCQLIEYDSTGELQNIEENLGVFSTSASFDIQTFHGQILHQALNALKDQDSEKREFNSCLFAINKSKLPALKKKIRDVFAEASIQNDKGDEAEIYCLSAQLFSTRKNH